MSETQQTVLRGDGTIVSCLITDIQQDRACGCLRGFALIGDSRIEVAYWQGDAYWYEQFDCVDDLPF